MLVDKELMLHGLNVDDGGINMKLGGEHAKLFLDMFVSFFEQNGGKNFLTLTLQNKEKKYAINIENCYGKETSAEKLQRQEAIIKQLVEAWNPNEWQTEAFMQQWQMAKGYLSESKRLDNTESTLALNESIRQVFAKDGYDGIVKLTLDWEQGVIREREQLKDGFGSIQEHFKHRKTGWHPTFYDAVNGTNEYTHCVE
ncbi:hypothetical protein PP175_28485 (plasmid) [Aneurinibacillus sp. Ricciae_BoGa-3]|uniref:hypothetical protein n=1 Tax=Aneurinibacillus sp. Ricciae_BoGa-3 TaxID=3022697 RepID=UPI0023403323|nr:hypothetical protein [Aneurinibacillus sp. Ricciae_BoGa-3]WCK57129.1 hypothetical protein PP175_28485 [Aneurinibacillus sp. Ricciae_BoGa-3]